MSGVAAEHDIGYEIRAVGLLTIAFGLVGIDRFAMNYMFPAMRADLGLSYQDLGNATGVLAFALGIAAFMAGPLTDRFGARAVIVPAVLTFSLTAGCSGLITDFRQLLVLRFAMGLADGAFATACIFAALNAAAVSRRALVTGVANGGLSILGLGLGPVLITALLDFTGSWRICFFIITIPGLVVALLLWRTLRPHVADGGQKVATGHEVSAGSVRTLLGYWNIWICAAIQTFVVGALVIVVTMTPSYMVDTLQMSEATMGTISSAIGIGTVVGALVITAASDRLGRKPTIISSILAAMIAVAALYSTGDNSALLFTELAFIAALCFATLFIVVGPVASESVPPTLAASATGFVIAVSEICGGSAAPSIGGWIAEHHDLRSAYLVSIAGLFVALILALLLRTRDTRAGGSATASVAYAASSTLSS